MSDCFVEGILLTCSTANGRGELITVMVGRGFCVSGILHGAEEFLLSWTTCISMACIFQKEAL